MVTVTEQAGKELNAYFEGKNPGTIRVYLASGCGGARLMLALDEAGTDDAAYEAGGYTFCVNKELLEKTSDITIDYNYMGFAVDSAIPLSSGGGCGCGSGASSCGSGGGGCGGGCSSH